MICKLLPAKVQAQLFRLTSLTSGRSSITAKNQESSKIRRVFRALVLRVSKMVFQAFFCEAVAKVLLANKLLAYF